MTCRSQDVEVIACYAKALHAVVISFDQQMKETALQDILFLRSYTDQNSDFVKFFVAKKISDSEKHAVISFLAESCSLAIANFLKVLAKTKRMSLLNGILVKFADLYDRTLGKIKVKLISMHTLEQVAISEISDTLSHKFGQFLEIENIVDNSILGGIILMIEDIRYDFSLRNALELMSDISKRAIIVLKENH